MKPTWGSELSSRDVARLFDCQAYGEDRERIPLWPDRPVARLGSFCPSRCSRRSSTYRASPQRWFSASRSERCYSVADHSPWRSSSSSRYARSASRSRLSRNSCASVAARRASWRYRAPLGRPRSRRCRNRSIANCSCCLRNRSQSRKAMAAAVAAFRPNKHCPQ